MLTHPIKNNELNIFIQKFTTIAVKKRHIGVETKIASYMNVQVFQTNE